MAENYILSPIAERDLLSPEPEMQASVSDDIDLFFNTPLDIFPFSETTKKPKRFHVFFGKAIADRFPDDEDMRGFIARYGRQFFGSMAGYMWVKRLLLAGALAAVLALLVWGGAAAGALGLTGAAAAGAVAGGMAVVYLIFAGVNALIFSQYRFSLENRSYELSRLIIQRTRELQNLYLTIKAMPDQEETRFPDGEAWGRRASYLMRLLLWVGQRMEYLERYLQMEMWRLRRERYWINWAGGFLVVVIAGAFTAALVLVPAPADEAGLFRVLQAAAGFVGLALALSSYHFWKTPLNLARDKLGAEGWVRYATLDLDNAIGDQVRRDKERIVEYRTLNKR
jgi:hypothetical protein